MALVKRRDLPVRPFHSADARNTSFKLPKIEKPPAIDYEKLRELCRIDGLKDVQNGVTQTSEEAHEAFMQNYKNIFVQKPKKLGFPIHSEQREQHKSSMLSVTHNATGKTMETDKRKPKKEWPIDKITHNIRDYMPLLHKQRKIEDPTLIRQENLKTLRRLARKLVYSVVTKDKNCEIFKIPAQIKQREHTEKVNLLLSCGQYKLWPRQPLLQVAELIEWISYPPNTVIVSEGYMAPFIGFIKTGECHILRQVEVMHTLSNGKREKRTKQVVMGRLGPSESFAELSVLLNEQITCSVVTATEMTLGVIRPEKIKDLDEVTIQLFKQSNNRTFGDLTKEDIQEEYMQQELKREWNEFKHGVLLDVINSRGIRPGYGKWSK
ncbi:uncharacterized protein LOC123548548 [Mercenaria mercenaria]|uniref:uncharacterized protein LOC123548548 n=1 Tax=Mercenaria mercenaria TaxID=6596 RepID=UPI00234EA791|nr:uncharacterized protein LOC123548548 [Mercenaria mercenaria]